MSHLLNKMIASKLAKLKAEADEGACEVSRDEVVAGRVVAALKQLGIQERRIHAALDDGSEPSDEDFVALDDTNPVTDDEIEAACRVVLAELGVDIDEENDDEGEDDELLDQISDLTAQLVANSHRDPQRLYKAASRLTASLNLTLVAAGKQK